MRDALTWLRHRNSAHPGDPVRVVGVGGSRVLPTDYDRVATLVEVVAPAEAAKVSALFDVIRTAHDSGEHVQRAHGTHPGTPFVELAREARAIAGQAGAEAEGLLDAIVEHHANATGVGYDAAREERAAADRVLALRPARVLLWEGSAHVAADAMLGGHLRAELGAAYAAVHVTFGYGQVHGVDVPPPAPGSLEDVLLAAGGERTVQLGDGAPAALAPWRTRLISGRYDPARDGEHYLEVRSLRGAYDAVVFVPEIASTKMLDA
jgi:erythromycin esterase